MGGISIIGTTGIVEPMSDEGWKKSLSLELSMLKEAGEDSVILTPGNIGVKNLTSRGAREKNVVKISNFVGYMLTEAVRLGFKRIVLAGHIGKLIKVAGGIFNTHSRIADARTDILISNLALMGAKREDLIKIASCLSSEEAARMVIDMGYGDVYKIIADKCRRNSLDYPRVDGEFELEVALYMLDGRLLGETDGMKDMLEKIAKSDKENEGGTDD